MAPRSILFVPGDRADRFGKALAAGADAVCVDLEDAVGGANKQAARDNVAAFLAGFTGDSPPARGGLTAPAAGNSGGPGLVVRMNDPRSEDGARDLEMIAAFLAGDSPRRETAGGRPRSIGIMIPKVRSVRDVGRVEDRVDERADERADEIASVATFFPIVETVAALEDAPRIAAASKRMAALVFGGFDLAVELGAEPQWEPLLYARSRVVHAAALAGTVAIDMPRREIRELALVREEAARARRLGFVGKIAIHPAQIGPIHEAFAPSAGEVARARRIVEVDRRAGGAAVSLGGKMVDRPVVEAARRVLVRVAGRLGENAS